MREGEENISCFYSYKGCIFNDMYVCTYMYTHVLPREEGRYLDRESTV